MTGLLAGVDAGGTKCTVRLERVDGTLFGETTFDADDWEAEPAAAAAAWIRARVDQAASGEPIEAIGVGAQGCDNPAVAAELGTALGELGSPAVVVNDAALLVPAAGLTEGIGVIAGTGSIAVGKTADGSSIHAGGWGWVIGDEGGGAALVRDATVAALTASDSGLDDDGLLAALLTAFEVPNAERLARAVNDDPSISNWAPRAPVVFAAAEAGSARAAAVVDGAAARLAGLVDQVGKRGAIGRSVVAAGSVIVNQPRMFDAFRAAVAHRHPELEVVLLQDDPVAGGVVLARRLSASQLALSR
ncbi:N-acetylglucosamine kinase [Humibacter ginsenosidimutans]|uniref:ATPase BadF/BadG/BcrA/BcrD type domain-containing protein n=1 Tax=Humibacter ginsenosidimutans TaxID=2599293 RepID=A0A5B8M997_9MICO|nr:BadF/BadG/BcrA/BcrD ATPase family protein [Humibacter ginsenosidimutans]QDZ16222.1 hypothetical protein FPZ11_16950 [Humibacter ginsenosidimutans]